MQAYLWLGFIAFVFVMMFLDLRVVGAKPAARGEPVPVRVALAWTGVCVALALCFLPVLKHLYDHHTFGIGLPTSGGEGHSGVDAVKLFLQGWLLEYSLSVDNLFVFAVIFAHFRVRGEHQHRVLAWGIIAALILRGVMIGMGTWLFHKFDWLLYVAGAFLIYTAVGMVKSGDDSFDVEKHWAARFVGKILPLEPRFHGNKFFVRVPKQQDGAAATPGAMHLAMTPLFLVLVVLNVVDVVFALDSIPAIFGVTTDPFLVFTSNVFAILGLRSLFFAIAALMGRFERLKHSLAFILAFIGVKMLLESGPDLSRVINAGCAMLKRMDVLKTDVSVAIPALHIGATVSLCVIVGALAVGIVASLLAKPGPAPGAGEEPKAP